MIAFLICIGCGVFLLDKRLRSDLIVLASQLLLASCDHRLLLALLRCHEVGGGGRHRFSCLKPGPQHRLLLTNLTLHLFDLVDAKAFALRFLYLIIVILDAIIITRSGNNFVYFIIGAMTSDFATRHTGIFGTTRLLHFQLFL